MLAEFYKDKVKYIKMFKGVYSGFKVDVKICRKEGFIVLLGYLAKLDKVKDYNY